MEIATIAMSHILLMTIPLQQCIQQVSLSQQYKKKVQGFHIVLCLIVDWNALNEDAVVCNALFKLTNCISIPTIMF